MRVALYSRCSTTDQKAELQTTELRSYAKSRGWQIVQEFQDLGWSGAKRERPEFQRCLADAEARKFDCVLVWKLDRWGRSLVHMIESIQRLAGAGVRFIAINSGIDTDSNNPAARLMLHLFAAFAEYERELIRERVAAGVRQYRADFAAGKAESHTGRNQLIGRPRKVFDRATASLMRSEGQSYASIAQALGISQTVVREALNGRKSTGGESPSQFPADTVAPLPR